VPSEVVEVVTRFARRLNQEVGWGDIQQLLVLINQVHSRLNLVKLVQTNKHTYKLHVFSLNESVSRDVSKHDNTQGVRDEAISRELECWDCDHQAVGTVYQAAGTGIMLWGLPSSGCGL